MKYRISNIELLRIFSIFIIILSHSSTYIPWDLEPGLYLNKFIIQFNQTFGKIGVNLFVMISGYFLIYSNRNNLKSIKKIWLQILTYSITIFLFVLLLNRKLITIKFIYQSFFPVFSNSIWFATAFIILMFLSQYLNLLLNLFSQKQFKHFLITTISIFFIFPTLFLNNNNVNNIIVLSIVYSIGAYIKKFDILTNIPKTKIVFYGLISLIIVIMGVLILEYFSRYFTFVNGKEAILFSLPFNIFSLIISVFIFLFVLNTKNFYSKFINLIASSSFGIYLFHENVIVRNILWDHVFNLSDKSASPLLFLYILISCLSIFIIGSLIDLIRQSIFKFWIYTK